MSTRKDFEEWFFDGAASRASERNGDGAYKYTPAAQAWAAWQASAENEREACALLLEEEAKSWGEYMETDEAKEEEQEGSGCSMYMSQARVDTLHDMAVEIRERSNAELRGRSDSDGPA